MHRNGGYRNLKEEAKDDIATDQAEASESQRSLETSEEEDIASESP